MTLYAGEELKGQLIISDCHQECFVFKTVCSEAMHFKFYVKKLQITLHWGNLIFMRLRIHIVFLSFSRFLLQIFHKYLN